MMPRPHKCRWINRTPGVQAFKPIGVPARNLEKVELQLDELEAIRLADSEGLYHEKAAERMEISRATFGRIVTKARQKVADALINGKVIIIKGGNVVVSDLREFECDTCRCSFHIPFGKGRPACCPSCGSREIHLLIPEGEVNEVPASAH
jgi:predicted DNA-binding protein (UPF0251 family)